MDSFQILKGKKQPSIAEVKAKLGKDKLQRFTDAYEAIKKKPSTQTKKIGTDKVEAGRTCGKCIHSSMCWQSQLEHSCADWLASL